MKEREPRRIIKTDFTRERIAGREFENYIFTGCNFARGDLTGCVFWDCIFEDCDLSLATTPDAAFRDAVFNGCKMLGFRFDLCNKLGIGFSFSKCNLDHSSFMGLKIARTVFTDCSLREVDFGQCDLNGASFDGCDLTRAVFGQTNLKKADLRTARGFSVDPEANTITGAKFTVHGLAGLLDKYRLDISEG